MVLTQPSFLDLSQNALFRGFRETDEALQDLLIQSDAGGGSTANVVLLRKAPGGGGTTVFCANVGDARAVLSDGIRPATAMTTTIE